MRTRVLLWGLIALLAVLLGFVTFPPVLALNLVKHTGYWFMLAATALFGWHFARSLRGGAAPRWREWRRWGWAAVVIIGGTLFLQTRESHGYKVVMDDVVLEGTAMQMHFHREVGVPVRAYDYVGNYEVLNSFLDKRPVFYPFLLATVHDLTGYRPSNAFVLNALLTPVLLLLLYLVGRRLAGELAGLATVLLICTVPLVAQNAVGAGFELLNLVMIVLTLWLGMRYAEAPSDDRLCAFALSGILLAEVRYESVLFIFPVGLVIVWTWWRQRRLSLPWTFLGCPLLLVLYAWQHNVFKVLDSSWQMMSKPEAKTPFALHYFYDNVGHALNFFFCWDGSQSNSLLVSALGVAGVAFLILLLYKRHREIFSAEPGNAVFNLFALTLLAHLGLMLCYFWGQFDDPVIRRLSLPEQLLAVLAFIYVLPQLWPRPAAWKALLGVTLVFLLGVSVPVMAQHRYTQENFAARTCNWVAAYIQAHPGREMLAIDANSQLVWIVNRQSSIPVAQLVAKYEGYCFHFRRHSFDDYLVVQRLGVDPKTGAVFPSIDEDLGDGFTLQTIAIKKFSPTYRIRLSRVTAIDEPKIKAWAKKRPKKFEPLPNETTVSSAGPADYLVTWLTNLP